jgi:hypothetical protein
MYDILTHDSALRSTLPTYSEAGFFFNEEAQLRQQDDGDFRLLTARHTLTQKTDARCAVFVDKLLAISPKAAPFGSIEFTENLPDSALLALTDSLEAQVRMLGLPAVRITNYPHAYAPRQSGRLISLLMARQYRIVDQLLNFHIDVTGEILSDRFHYSERRRLAKCLCNGFRVEHWVRPAIPTVLDFIQQSRRQQGYPLTIAPDRLAHLLRTFPDQYPVFAVWDGSTLASLTVAVRVRHDILYNFLPADNLDYRHYSPSVLLTQGLYTYCQQERVRLLDLGVAVDDHRRPKPDLMRFKRNLGATTSLKVVLEKQLA